MCCDVYVKQKVSRGFALLNKYIRGTALQKFPKNFMLVNTFLLFSRNKKEQWKDQGKKK